MDTVEPSYEPEIGHRSPYLLNPYPLSSYGYYEINISAGSRFLDECLYARHARYDSELPGCMLETLLNELLD